MTRYILIICTAFILSGCEEAMTAKEIDEAIKECNEHNLTYHKLSSMYVDSGLSITKIRCGGRL